MWNTHQNSESLFLCPSVYVPLLKGIPVYRCLLWDIVGLVMFSVCFLNMETPSCLKTPPNEPFMNTDVEHCLKRLNKEGKQMESNMKNAPLSKKASPLHTFTTKSNIFDTNLPQAACESSPKLTDRLQWNAASRLLFWQHLWQSEQSCNFPLSVSVLSLPANLPENPKLCWDMKCLLVPPFISRHYYLQHLQEVLENMKTKGWHAWAGEGRKCGSTEGRTWCWWGLVQRYAADQLLSIIQVSLVYWEMTAVGPTLLERGSGDVGINTSCYSNQDQVWNFEQLNNRNVIDMITGVGCAIYVSYLKLILFLWIAKMERNCQAKATLLY